MVEMKKLNDVINRVFPKKYEVVFLHAHPDDESFLSAGLLNELILRGRKCTVVFGAAIIVDGQTKTIMRRKETNKACNILGNPSVLYLDFCDSKYLKNKAVSLKEGKIKEITQNLLSILRKNGVRSPFTLISYDKNGGYGNIDHKKIHAVGKNFRTSYKNLVVSSFEITINRNKVLKWLRSVNHKYSLQFIPKLSYWAKDIGLSENQITY